MECFQLCIFRTFSPPDFYHDLSLRLSAVLDDIGVNEVMVMKRRRLWMLTGALENIQGQILSRNFSVSYFGSQTEGSTTQGLKSDIDILYCNHDIRIIQDWSEWKQDKTHQFLIVQDDTTSPGYCLLQAVRSDVPLPGKFNIDNEYINTDTRGRTLLRHSYCFAHLASKLGSRHGPASVVQGKADQYDRDYVYALNCSSWPKEANPWLQKQNVSGWPTEDMKRYSSEQGCFVVPVGSRTGIHQDTKWRISTSFAERYLMFHLNITHMRCYVLMKMIFKTFLQPKFEDTVSSFMCKNILFHCIANSATSITWNEYNLVTCLIQCLQALYNCILTERCPHFIIPGNNLLAGKLTTEVKHQLVEILRALIGNIEQPLLSVQIDDLGERLYVKSGQISHFYLKPAYLIADHMVCYTVDTLTELLFRNIWSVKHTFSQDSDILTTIFSNRFQIHSGSDLWYKAASSLYTPFLCSIIGSRKASADLQHSQVLSPEALTWLSLGENSDISTGKLNLASAMYCFGDLQKCESILAALKRQLLHTTVVTYCCCYDNMKTVSEDFMQIFYYKTNEEVIKHHMAFCVAYLPCEINCIPNDMKYEMFRSTERDQPYRGRKDFRMDWAVVDSHPYLYFLQYKVYSQLQRPADQHRAIEDLARTIDTDPNLGHRETAWNLLGQCMEQENQYNVALKCYIMSLRVRGRNNAAKWLICRLLARLFRA